MTDFVLSSVQEAARRAIEEHQRLDLSVRDSEAFVEALLNPQLVRDGACGPGNARGVSGLICLADPDGRRLCLMLNKALAPNAT